MPGVFILFQTGPIFIYGNNMVDKVNHSPNTNFMAGSPTGPDEFGQRVQAVRRFNRFYTRQIGVLQEGLLNSSLSLSEVRVLYELAHREKPIAAELCKELELDAGYLSRILRAFHKRGWILRESSQHDARRSLLSLSRRGRAAFERAQREVEPGSGENAGRAGAKPAVQYRRGHADNRIHPLAWNSRESSLLVAHAPAG